MHVLGVHTPLLGNRVYSEMLRRAFASSPLFRYDAHWSTEQQDVHGDGRLERQLERVFHKSWEPLRANNLQLWTLRYELGTSYWGRRTLNALLRAGRPDALHFHSQNVALLSPDVMRKIPTVVSCDTTSYRMAEQRLDERWRFTFAPSHAIERAVFHAAYAVVAFSEWAGRTIVERHGLPPERVHVIPPGVDIARFASLPAHGEAPGRQRSLLFVGGEFERKGGPALLEVFAERFAASGGVRLDIVTHDDVVSPVPNVVVHRGVEPFGERWYELYANADIFVLPTKFDQLGIAYLEAMAAGLPVVTTAVGAATEIVADGETGYVVPSADMRSFGDRVARLLAEPPLRAAFGVAARARVAARYDATVLTARMERLLYDAARGGSRRRAA